MSSLINGKIHESLVLAFANLFIHWGAKSSLPRFFVVYVRNEIDQASCIVQYIFIVGFPFMIFFLGGKL